MATSGSFNYSATASEVIQGAMENIGELGGGESPSNDDADLCLRKLNRIVKQLQALPQGGLKLWSRQRVTLFLAKGQQTYLIGPASTDARASTQYGRTTLSAAEAAGQTVLSITANTDTTTYPGTTVTMTASDFIGIELDDGTIQWSTISGTPSTTATIADALTGAAAAGNYVYWFTSRAQRFPEIEYAVLHDKDGNDLPLSIYSTVADYESMPDKGADGSPTSILVEPLRLNTRITLDSQPTDVTDQINLTVIYPAEDYDALTNDIAFPQEWINRIEWELALAICPAFGATWTPAMQASYLMAVKATEGMNPETTDVYFQPGLD